MGDMYMRHNYGKYLQIYITNSVLPCTAAPDEGRPYCQYAMPFDLFFLVFTAFIKSHHVFSYSQPYTVGQHICGNME